MSTVHEEGTGEGWVMRTAAAIPPIAGLPLTIGVLWSHRMARGPVLGWAVLFGVFAGICAGLCAFLALADRWERHRGSDLLPGRSYDAAVNAAVSAGLLGWLALEAVLTIAVARAAS
ncbi:hypothetical protein [Streptomyces luteireticuli]|uniref:hypothetical protein n=1 Tax=Streptomyces luteireticuli TaxID=173858 RepID=UPI0035573553